MGNRSIPNGSITKRCRKCSRQVPRKETPSHCPDCGTRLQSDTVSWGWRIRIPAPDGGRTKARSKSGYGTEREARDALDELRSSLRDGTYVTPQNQTVGTYLNGWIQSIRHDVSEGTWSSYEGHIRNYIGPRIGDIPLQGLTRTEIRTMLADLRDNGRIRGNGGLAPKTVHNVFLTLHVALASGVKDRLLQFNPAEDAHTISKDDIDADTVNAADRWWRPGEVEAFLAHVAEDDFYAMWHVLGWTGARRGEVAAMRWNDLDLDAGTWTITRQLRKGRDGQPSFATLKAATHNSPNRQRRTVALVPMTIKALRAHRAAQNELRLLHGNAYEDHGLVFCRANGRPLHPDGITQRFERHVRQSGLRRIRLHDLRHSHATWCLDQGMPVHKVSRRLGHSSIQITVNTYGHDDVEGQQTALEAALARAQG